MGGWPVPGPSPHRPDRVSRLNDFPSAGFIAGREADPRRAQVRGGTHSRIVELGNGKVQLQADGLEFLAVHRTCSSTPRAGSSSGTTSRRSSPFLTARVLFRTSFARNPEPRPGGALGRARSRVYEECGYGGPVTKLSAGTLPDLSALSGSGPSPLVPARPPRCGSGSQRRRRPLFLGSSLRRNQPDHRHRHALPRHDPHRPKHPLAPDPAGPADLPGLLQLRRLPTSPGWT